MNSEKGRWPELALVRCFLHSCGSGNESRGGITVALFYASRWADRKQPVVGCSSRHLLLLKGHAGEPGLALGQSNLGGILRWGHLASLHWHSVPWD